MTDLQSLVAPTYDDLANLLAGEPAEAWDAPSLCERWQVRHVVAHATMPARLTPEQFGAEMAAAAEFYRAYDTDHEHNRLRHDMIAPICVHIARVQISIPT